MSLLRSTWRNFADTLFDREAVLKLDTHVRVTDDQGSLLDPVPDPHPQYFHLVNDTAWAGMRLTTDQLLTPGSILAPFDTQPYPDWRLVSDLPNGSITVPTTEGGGYQFNVMGAFQAASNGGSFLFQLYANGAPTGLVSVADLSNQSDTGPFVMVGFFPFDVLAGALTLDLRLDAVSSKNVTILDCTWTMFRTFPPSSEVSDTTQIQGHTVGDSSWPPFVWTPGHP